MPDVLRRAEPAGLPAGGAGLAGDDALGAPPAGARLTLTRVNFDELYRRHLCRHSQLGINVLHLAALAVTYLALLGLAALWVPVWPWLAAAAAVYLAFGSANLPTRVTAVTALFVAGLLAATAALPPLRWWAYVLAVVAAHQAQNLSHRPNSRSTDMSAFTAKYPKGPTLFVLLLVYELPILLNYLAFGRADWRR